MKLTQEHIGKWILGVGWGMPAKLVSIHEDNAWFGTANVYGREDDWKIVEPKKKPSERISEIMAGSPLSGYTQKNPFAAILEYLDEMAEAKQ